LGTEKKGQERTAKEAAFDGEEVILSFVRRRKKKKKKK